MKFFYPMRILFSCYFLSLLLISSSWGAWKLRSDFRAIIEPELLARQLGESFQYKPERESFSLEDIEETRDDLSIRVRGIEGIAEYEIAPFQYKGKSGASLLWDAYSSYLGVSINVDEIYAETYTTERFNGGIIRVRLRSTCNNIRVSLPRNAGASINIRASSVVSGSKLQLTADSSNLFWPEKAWEITNIDCHGNDGFRKRVEELVQEYVDRIRDSFEEDFESRLRSRLQDLSKEFSEEILTHRLLFSDDEESIKIDLEPEYIDQSSSADLIMGGSLRGYVPTVFDGYFQETDRRFTSHGDIRSGRTETQLPLSILNDVLLGSHLFELFKAEGYGSEFSEWEEFRRDSRAVRHVFPDLSRFSLSKDFKINAGSLYNPSLKNIVSRGPGRGVRGKFFFPIFINIKAPYLGNFIPYVQFRGYVEGYTSIRVSSDGKLEFFIESSDTFLNYYWNLDYLKNFNPNERIRIELISKEMDKMLRGSSIHWDLPQLDLNGQKLDISDFSVDNDVIRVFWKQGS